jgi:hypothetical protein
VSEKEKEDNDGYDLKPNCEKKWVFSNFQKMPNLVKHYTEWAMMIQNVGYYMVGPHRIKYLTKICLGIFLCPNSDCNYSKRPPQKKREKTLMLLKCICGTNLIHIECSAKLLYDECEELSMAIVRHSGFHEHPCPHVEKADYYSKKLLEEKIHANPKKKPLSLVVGESLDENGITSSTRHIHPAFNNKDRVAYLHLLTGV